MPARNTPNLPHDDEDDSDPESDLVSIAEDEFPNYFREIDGRLFHNTPTAPYPLPVDTAEQLRVDVQNNVLRGLIGRNYVGPVTQTLAPVAGVERFIVDFCCGQGNWILQMADEFPHAMLIGLDIVPIATRYPPHNVCFEMHDIRQQTRFDDGTIDLVHVRDCSMAVENYSWLIQEASRILRPGGILVFGEFERFPAFDQRSQPAIVPPNPWNHMPQFCRFYEMLNHALERRRLRQIENIPAILARTGSFRHITPLSYEIPIGEWPADEGRQRLGSAYHHATERFLDSARPLLELQGVRPDFLDALYATVKIEIVNAYHLRPVARYQTGYAIRL